MNRGHSGYICHRWHSPRPVLYFLICTSHSQSACMHLYWTVPVNLLGLFLAPAIHRAVIPHPLFPPPVNLPVFSSLEAPLIPLSPPPYSYGSVIWSCELCCVTRSVCQNEYKCCSVLSQSTHPPPLDSTLGPRPISIFSIFHSLFFFCLPCSCYHSTL